MLQCRRSTISAGPAAGQSLADGTASTGVEVQYEPPLEQRGAETMAEAVAAYYFLKGSDAALKVAVERVRARFGSMVKIEEADEETDD